MKKHILLRRFVRAAACLLALLLTVASIGPMRADAAASQLVSVGLYFVKNALPSANLQNVAGYGSGYDIGIYDLDASGDRKQFVRLASTDETEISMLIDRNMYLSGSSYTEAPSGSGVSVGAYHAELAYAYSDYASAAQSAQNYADGFVAWCDGQYRVRFGSYETYREALDAAQYYSDCTATGQTDYGMTVVATQTGRILFELDMDEQTALGIVPSGSGETRTWFKGYQYNGGFRYDRPGGGSMHVASIVPLEQYVASVLSREFVTNWPDETLKAASCCIRSFVSTASKHQTFDVCNDTCCQVYRGVYQYSPWDRLVSLCQQTAGQQILYQGAPILAVYHSSNGGATVSASEAWHTDIPYLQGRYDPFEAQVNTGAKDWQRTLTYDELTRLANAWGFDCTRITAVAVTGYTELGNVAAVTFTDQSGRTHTFTDEDTLLFGGEFYSRRYVILPPHSSQTVTDVSGGAAAAGGTASTAEAYGGPYAVYDGSSTTTAPQLYAVTAAGTEVLSGSAAVLGAEAGTGGEYPAPELTTRTVVNDSDYYMIYGSGWGHNVGLSAYGAYAMGLQGYSYQDILKFYYQGVSIG